MTEDAAHRVLKLRQRLDRVKDQIIEARAHQRSAEDQLTAADDEIRRLGLDPDRDLERQVDRAIIEVEQELQKLEHYVEEVESILEGD